MDTRILLLGHGTVDNLDDLPPFLSNIRRGRPAPPELLREVRRRYELIGGSPLLKICRELAGNLEKRVGTRVHVAMRFWHPFAKEVLSELARAGCQELEVLPLAPYSGALYAAEMRRLADELSREGATPPELRCAPSWGAEPSLVEAFARALGHAVLRVPAERRDAAHVLFTAHSLPVSVIEKGDPYPHEVDATARAVAVKAGLSLPWRVVYQSQGASAEPWLGPDVRSSIASVAAAGAKDVVFCPIGFLSDHIEVLYDLDIEARAWAEQAGLGYVRTESLNASQPLVDTLAAVAAALRTPA